jgi:hypothetical protein
MTFLGCLIFLPCHSRLDRESRIFDLTPLPLS